MSDAIQGIDCIRVHSIYGHKGPLRHDAPDPAEYFERFAEALGMWLTETLVTSSDRVLINFDSVLTKGQRGKLMQRLKARLNDTSQSYRISFMPVKSDFNGQIADYFAWSLFRQLERLDDLPLRALSGITQEVRELDEQSRISIEDQHRHPGEK
ncbi:hypothetical protein D9V32_11320 [Mycetocola tolaasinivorans]|uniref:DUF3800 domain-containing protein n=1 Tax=Mycetocola tolaasinivorans TaxID=76635 RepID=A0A3L7A475_9MICO|nr:hypothetical protein D9V32_11320 [Mycetocola tolaasinivorans]